MIADDGQAVTVVVDVTGPAFEDFKLMGMALMVLFRVMGMVEAEPVDSIILMLLRATGIRGDMPDMDEGDAARNREVAPDAEAAEPGGAFKTIF